MTGMAEVHPLKENRVFFSSELPEGLKLQLNCILMGQYADASRGNTPVRLDPPQMEASLLEIKQCWPEVIDPYIALFKFYFRSARFFEAEQVVWQGMKLLSGRAGFSHHYMQHQPSACDWLENDSHQRNFLFCMKALGVIRLRRGKVNAARKVLGKLAVLDPHDEIGGGSFLQITQQF